MTRCHSRSWKTWSKKTEFLEPKGAFTNPVKAVEYLTTYHIDILFLDIEMPELTGFELLKTLEQKPQIIIVSRKEKYALPAFEFEVVDYLLKPVTDYSRFLKAVVKAKKNLEAHQPVQGPDEEIFIKVDSLLKHFNLSDILWLEGYGDYVKVKTPEKIHVIYTTLKHIETSFPSDKFLRVHRSFIINLSRIDNIDSGNLQIGDKIIPIGKSYRDELMGKIRTL